ncbi:hypothetical protein ACFX11_034726 [Malus domestica]
MMRQYLKRRARGIAWFTRLTEGARKKLNTNVRECKNIIVAHADAVKTSLKCMTFLKGTLCDCLQATAIVWNGKLEGFHVNICVHALYGSEPTQKTTVMNSSPKRSIWHHTHIIFTLFRMRDTGWTTLMMSFVPHP